MQATTSRDATSQIMQLALPLLEVTTSAAAQCHPWVGRGNVLAPDCAAVAAMREALKRVPGDGIVVIGEGKKDRAPMLHAGDKVGVGVGPRFDLAVDPLEGTSLCATGVGGAVTVLAVAPRGTLAPLSCYYLDKIVVGPRARGVIDIAAPVEDNLSRVAKALGSTVERLRVAVLNKPRHAQLLARIRAAGAIVIELEQGDLMAGFATLIPGGGVDMAIGVGGAPEGVITACAVRILGGDMQACPAPQGTEEKRLAQSSDEYGTTYEAETLARSSEGVFVVSGVTGSLNLAGVAPVAGGLEVHSIMVAPDQRVLRISSVVSQY